jgi:hypothetical protein
MSDYESNLERYDDCLRAFVQGARAIERGDLGAGLDGLDAALTGLIRLLEDAGHIPKNRRPRRLPRRSRPTAPSKLPIPEKTP